MEQRYESFTVLIHKISRNIKRIKADEMAEFHLKGPHVSCLYYLYQFDGLTPTQLSEMCDEDKASISRSLEHLEKEGYLIRSKSNKYRNKIQLTIQGCEVAMMISEKIQEAVIQSAVGIREEQRQNMYEALHLISNNLDNIVQKNRR